MRKTTSSIVTTVLFVLFVFLPVGQRSSFAASQAVEYLNELGISFYQLGRYDDALQEFNKTLLIDSRNSIAKDYVDKIFKKNMGINDAPQQPPRRASAARKSVSKSTPATTATTRKATSAKAAFTPRQGKGQAMDDAFMQLAQQANYSGYAPSYTSAAPIDLEETAGEKKPKGYKVGALRITGDMQIAAGFTSDDYIWKQANYDLNSKNWRMLSDEALNKRFNTFDTRVYDSLNVNIDTENKEGFNFHSNIAVDPWSFTAKSEKTTVTSLFGDTAQIQLKYWSNTGYLLNESYYTQQLGNTFNIPETKVRDGMIDPFNVGGGWGDIFSIPGLKVERQFQPVREFWFDYTQSGTKVRVFPIGYQDQALSSGDPLRMTNRHMWWENSLWLRRYLPGHLNPTPGDYTKGFYDNSIAQLARDSNGVYLTALRGATISLDPGEGTTMTATVATPKDLWQDYDEADNVIGAMRANSKLTDQFSVGSIFTSRVGLDTYDGSRYDAGNYVGGIDLGYELVDGIKATTEVLMSHTKTDARDEIFDDQRTGNMYYFSLFGRYPFDKIMDLQYGYDEIKPGKDETFLVKSRFYAAHIDKGFYSALSSFRNTRYDTFWSRHMTFRKPFEYYYAGLKSAAVNWDEVNASRIGDGMDIGRNTVGFRAEVMVEDKFNNLVDVRNARTTEGKMVETVARDEVTVKLTDKLTAKGLYIYTALPDTKPGIDPFIFDERTGDFVADWSANPIDGEKDPSLQTGSLGLEYAFYEWLSANFIWEITNDYTMGYGNFPRGVFNSAQLADVFYQNGVPYRQDQPFVYDQQIFPQPPYPFYNIFKTGLRFNPIDKMEVYLDYTRNSFAHAGQISDNMNHVGLEITYEPFKKFGMSFKYTYSRWKNPILSVQGDNKMRGHNNFFSEFRYMNTENDEWILEYGEGGYSPAANITFDPYGGSLSTIDTQHIIRAYYRRKF